LVNPSPYRRAKPGETDKRQMRAVAYDITNHKSYHTITLHSPEDDYQLRTPGSLGNGNRWYMGHFEDGP